MGGHHKGPCDLRSVCHTKFPHEMLWCGQAGVRDQLQPPWPGSGDIAAIRSVCQSKYYWFHWSSARSTASAVAGGMCYIDKVGEAASTAGETHKHSITTICCRVSPARTAVPWLRSVEKAGSTAGTACSRTGRITQHGTCACTVACTRTEQQQRSLVQRVGVYAVAQEATIPGMVTSAMHTHWPYPSRA